MEPFQTQLFIFVLGFLVGLLATAVERRRA
jgi:hypothetical protein